MSVWAQSWAYEQRLGKWRKNKKGEDLWKGDSGAKSVLAAAATFADEDGYAFCGQDTLAEMCDMTPRTVREHLYNLEHGYKKIRREHRKKGDGTYTSDGIWLLAPKSRLRPPKTSDGEDDSPPAEKFSVGEKRAHQRKTSTAGPAEKFSGEPSGVEPSVDSSEKPAGNGRAPAREGGQETPADNGKASEDASDGERFVGAFWAELIRARAICEVPLDKQRPVSRRVERNLRRGAEEEVGRGRDPTAVLRGACRVGLRWDEYPMDLAEALGDVMDGKPWSIEVERQGRKRKEVSDGADRPDPSRYTEGYEFLFAEDG